MNTSLHLDEDTDAREISQWVYQEKIKMLYVNHRHSWHASLFVSAIVASFSFGGEHYISAVIWWLCFASITALRVIVAEKSCKNTIHKDDYKKCHKYLFWLAMLAGSAWGVGGLVVAMPLDDANRLIVLLILVGVCAAAVPMLGILQNVMLAFQLPAVVPYLFWLAYGMEDKALILALVLLCYIAGVVVAMKRVELSIVKGLRIQYRMEKMADSLQESNQALHRANEKLEHMSLEDPLTKLYNRRYFEKHLDNEWKRSVYDKNQMTLMVIDVDYFKLFNDTYGHVEGDICLKKIAKILQESLQSPDDIVARIGGEEFVALLSGVGKDDARKVAQVMKENLHQAAIDHASSSANEHVTVSIGIASSIPVEGVTALSLLKAADKALYEAKTSGRNQMAIAEMVVH